MGRHMADARLQEEACFALVQLAWGEGLGLANPHPSPSPSRNPNPNPNSNPNPPNPNPNPNPNQVQLESQRVLRAVEQVTIVGLAIASKGES